MVVANVLEANQTPTGKLSPSPCRDTRAFRAVAAHWALVAATSLAGMV